MAKFINWESVKETDPILGPPKPWQCIEGWISHLWTLNIEEAQLTLTTDCNLCSDGIESLTSEQPEMLAGELKGIRMEFYDDVSYNGEHDPYFYLSSTSASDEPQL